MNKLLPLIIFFVLANVNSLAQRDRTPGGRGSGSQIPQKIYRIEKSDRDSKTRNPQKTIEHQQQLRPKTKPPIREHFHKPKKYKQSYQFDCVVNYSDKYNFPDRIYQIEGIDLIIQKFFEEDFDGAIESLNFLIEENPFMPEFYFLRGVAYIKRKTDFKKSDYWAAENDFFTVKTLDPNFPKLKHYFDLLDFYLHGKRSVIHNTTR